MHTATARLEQCQKRIGYQFKNPKLLKAALTHSSVADHRRDSNERMEFLGDAVMGLVVCQELYERLPESMEGDLTKIKSAVVSRRTCADVADRMHLSEALHLGQGMEPGDHLPRSLGAAALEALIAAVYLDGGFLVAREFVLRLMAPDIDAACESQHQFNFKSQLQQFAQRELGATPQYELLDEKGPDHAKCFEIAVTVGRKRFPGAWGPSKKEAEQKAAYSALIALGQLTPDEDDADADAE
ncbi:Ribonuclease 3 [Phycisphaerae bacterium RAS1]|nr:Ribonuclease 3 [Phycisphaerae bacterium RAS1]